MTEENDKKEKKEPFDKAQGDSVESDTSEVLEFEFNEDGEEDLKKTIKKLRADLKLCKKEKDEYLTGWQKERADFINYKKQEEDRKINFSESLRERILTRFLTVLDSFHMAFMDKETWEKVDENWRKGVEYIFSQMNTIFDEYGVKPLGEPGESFDPNVHQSIEMVPTDKKEEDHKIAQVIQKGYKLGDRVIRAARVNVFEYHESEGK
jgi:molecular chaperone GrpE